MREHTWLAAWIGESAATAGFDDVVEELGASAMISCLTDGSNLTAQVMADGSATLVPLGSLRPVETAVLRLVADLEVLAVGLAVAACQAGYYIYFTTLDDPIRRLRAAEATGRFARQLTAFGRGSSHQAW